MKSMGPLPRVHRRVDIRNDPRTRTRGHRPPASAKYASARSNVRCSIADAKQLHTIHQTAPSDLCLSQRRRYLNVLNLNHNIFLESSGSKYFFILNYRKTLDSEKWNWRNVASPRPLHCSLQHGHVVSGTVPRGWNHRERPKGTWITRRCLS